MPLYEYQCEAQCGRFEQFRPFSAKPLRECPQCGAAAKRVISAPTIHGAGSVGKQLSNKNLGAKGFTKYERAGDGYYEKRAGEGPDVIRR